MKALISLCFVPMLAFATGSHDDGNPNTVAQSQSHAQAASAAVAGAQAKQAQVASSDQSLTSTNTATGGAGGAGGNGGQGGAGGVANQSQQANNAGNSQHITIQGARQTPWVVLPSIFVADCGSGVNAGGSKAGGAGAFGVTWTTAKCYDFKNGTNFVAIGAIEEACVLWTDVNRKAFKRQKYTPDCKAIALRVYEGQKLVHPAAELKAEPAVAMPDMSLYATKEDLNRAFKTSASK